MSMELGMGQIVRCEVLQGVRKDSLRKSGVSMGLGTGQSEIHVCIWGMQGDRKDI